MTAMARPLGLHISPLHVGDRAEVFAMGHEDKVYAGADESGDEKDGGPVEVCCIDGTVCWPESPKECPQRVADCREVDGDPEPAQREFGWGECFWVHDSAPQQAANGETVTLEKGDGDERRHGEEGDCAADVDETEAGSDNASEEDGVPRNAPPLIDGSDPIREGEALVASECPDVSSHCGEVCNGTAHDKKQDECEEDG